MTTFANLYAQRCYGDKPHFWIPQACVGTPYTLFGDDEFPVREEWGVDTAIQRVLALASFLELPVGGWIGDFTNKEKLRIPEEALPLLKSNIKDETFHDRGVRMAIEGYPVSGEVWEEAKLIAEQWLSNPASTLQKACFAETGVFLCTLAILRLCGGKELANLAEQISRDEARHVATNRGLLAELGESPTNPPMLLRNLIYDTVAWVSESLHIPAEEICAQQDFDQDFLLRSSDSLIETGTAYALDSILNFSVHILPFETSNAAQYSRAVVDVDNIDDYLLPL